jgi:peptidoglycan/LPS O-acetylase OafA/YrhL
MNGQAAYRADIDGLRALAVLAVIAFHAWPAGLTGGFAGVDIFFAISGFLITGVISRDAAAGGADRFCLARFYNRRIKRLLPAYAVVALATLAAASYLMIPNDYVFFTTSLAASWGFVSNVFFSLLSWGYFGQRTEEFPLLHTWSLSVEEQFYFFYPLLLVWLLRRRPRHATAVLAALALVTLALSQWRAPVTGAYFLLPYRAHELLLGALAARAAGHAPPGRTGARTAAVAGLCLALAPLFLLHRGTVFPGFNSLFPSAGAALLLYAGCRANTISSWLGVAPLAAIGRLSYALYLWHWPLFSFMHYRHIPFDAGAVTLACAATAVLSWLTYRYIEQPVRRNGSPLRASALRYYAAPAAAALAIGAVSYFTEGLPARFSATERELIASYSFERDLTGACAIKSGAYSGVTPDYLEQRCTAGDQRQARAEMLLFGDSHANHFKPFLARLALHGGIKLAYFVEGSCSAIDLYDPAEGAPAGPSACQRRNADLLAMAPRYRYVALATFWQYKGREPLFARRLGAALGQIAAAGAIPVIFKDNPSLDQDLSRCVLFRRRGWIAPGADCDMAAPAVAARQGSMDAVIDDLQRRFPQTVVIDLKQVMCDTRICRTSIGNVALYKDANHINLKAAELLAQRYMESVGNPLARQALRPDGGHAAQ